jgi:hypothetical protein
MHTCTGLDKKEVMPLLNQLSERIQKLQNFEASLFLVTLFIKF